jgi:hypothetical protein
LPPGTCTGSINPVDELRQETKSVEQSLPVDTSGGYALGPDDQADSPEGVDHEGDRDHEAAKQDDRGDEAELSVVKMTSTAATHTR